MYGVGRVLKRKTSWAGCLTFCLVISVAAKAAPPVVIEPAGGDDRVAAGYDFATQELGDPWDMDRMEDMFTPNALEVVNETITAGVYNFDTIETDLPGITRAQFWMMHPGVLNTQRLVNQDRNPVSGLSLYTREIFPIDPTVYRYFTARVRMTSATASPLVASQPFIVYFFEDHESIGSAEFGNSTAFYVPANEWTIVRLDLATDVDINAPQSWSAQPQWTGLRIDPTVNPDVHVEVDWVRLTASPVLDEFFNVSWSGNGAGDYSIFARSDTTPDAVAFELASGVAATSMDVNLSELPPGDYRIEVEGAGETGVSPV